MSGRMPIPPWLMSRSGVRLILSKPLKRRHSKKPFGFPNPSNVRGSLRPAGTWVRQYVLFCATVRRDCEGHAVGERYETRSENLLRLVGLGRFGPGDCVVHAG